MHDQFYGLVLHEFAVQIHASREEAEQRFLMLLVQVQVEIPLVLHGLLLFVVQVHDH